MQKDGIIEVSSKTKKRKDTSSKMMKLNKKLAIVK